MSFPNGRFRANFVQEGSHQTHLISNERAILSAGGIRAALIFAPLDPLGRVALACILYRPKTDCGKEVVPGRLP